MFSKGQLISSPIRKTKKTEHIYTTLACEFCTNFCSEIVKVVDAISCLRLDSFLHGTNIINRSRCINVKINTIRHVWTSSEIADWLCEENCVWVIYFLIVIAQEHCCQNVHLFNNHLQYIKHMNAAILLVVKVAAEMLRLFFIKDVSNVYLHAVNYAAIPNVKGVHHEHKNDGLEHSFAHILEHKSHEQQLRCDHKDYLRCRQTHYQE